MHKGVGSFYNYLHAFAWSSCSRERGFSVNSGLLVEDLQEKTLVASLFVYSNVKSDANHFSELFFPQTETKCSGSKNAMSVVCRRAKKTLC